MTSLHRIISTLMATAVLTLLGSCSTASKSVDADTLESVQHLIEISDYAAAASLLDDTRDNALASGDAELMTRYSILYMKLADASDSQDMVGYAYQCLSKAYTTDSAATTACINNLPVDDLAQAAAVKILLGASDMTIFHDDSDYPDSLYIEQTEQ